MWLSPETYAKRRRAVMDRIGNQAAAIIPSAPISTRSNDVEYPYRADNDFLYLTGFREPEAVCVLAPGHPKGEFVLFVRPRDRERETWTGRRCGIEGALGDYRASQAHAIQELEKFIGEYVADREHLYYSFGRDGAFNDRVTRWLQQWRQGRPRTGKGPLGLLDPSEFLHEMRLIKSEEEIAEMRQAAAIARRGHVAALESVRPGMFEYEIEAILDYTFRRHGASGPAYPSIVAAGANATVLHYTENDRVIGTDDLLLIDAGAEYRGYCSDVTRTFPAGPRFSPAQRKIYDIVLRAQLEGIERVRPGVAVDAPHQGAVEVLVEGLLEVGLLTGDASDIIANEKYRAYYMHRTSHWLGMDVHDVGRYKLDDASRVLEPGMVLTVEPGLYVAADAEEADPQFRGIGVRIEDDVLVTATGHEVLSADIPKDPAEIEDVRSRHA
jgi:Xaa-Pro aminopeptidase